jgi:hypothetical protein
MAACGLQSQGSAALPTACAETQYEPGFSSGAPGVGSA